MSVAESLTDEQRIALERKKLVAAEIRLLQQMTETSEATLQMYWPDRELGLGGGAVDKTLLDAIQDNLPLHTASWPPYETLEDVFEIQEASRLLCTFNEFAKGGVRNRQNFVVGHGHAISVEAKEGYELTEAETNAANGVIKAFEKRNNWRKRQLATQLRLDRDGEAFRRKFYTPAGIVLRFIEPEDVRPPMEAKEAAPFGIEFAAGDVESPLAYWVARGKDDFERLDASLVQHVKHDDDLGCVRGLPLFMAAKRSLAGAASIQRHTTALTKIQSHYAVIRKHLNAIPAQIQAAVSAQSTVQVNPSSGTGQPIYGKEMGPGGIHDVPAGVEYDFPSSNSHPENFLPPKDSALRAAAASVVMPEYMFTADASNGNFASTTVAESPATREFQRGQWDLIEADREIIEEDIALAIARGDLPADFLERAEICIDPPDPAVRNAKEQAETRLLDQQLGVSPQTLIRESGRDYEKELQNNQEHIDATGGVPGPGFPLMNNNPPPEPTVRPKPPTA